MTSNLFIGWSVHSAMDDCEQILSLRAFFFFAGPPNFFMSLHLMHKTQSLH